MRTNENPSNRNFVSTAASRRGFFIIDKPTKSASERILVGQPATRRKFLINDELLNRQLSAFE